MSSLRHHCRVRPCDRRLLLQPGIARILVGILVSGFAATTLGCSWGNGGRPPVPNAATNTADAASLGPSVPGPDCYLEPERTSEGAYPGPGSHGKIYGYVGTALDASCRWRARSLAAEGATVLLYLASLDGDFGSGDFPPIASARTNASGCYEFMEIETPGEYMVVVEPERAICDSDDYSSPGPGLVQINLHPIAPVASANFGLAP